MNRRRIPRQLPQFLFLHRELLPQAFRGLPGGTQLRVLVLGDGEIGAECSVWTKDMPEWVTLDEACGPEPQMPLEVAAAYLLAQHPASSPAGAGTPEVEGSLEAMMAAAGASAEPPNVAS